MSKYKGIFVGGIPGAGCTLMRRLFLSFKGTKAPEFEMFPDQLVMSLHNYNEKGEILVTSRCGQSVYSQGLDSVEAARQASILADNGVGVLLMVRDMESQRRLSKENWALAMSETIIHWDKVHYTLPYARLIKEPDVVQVEIAEVFGMEIVHKFSAFPDFIDQDSIPETEVKGAFTACHSLRRIGASYKEEEIKHRTTPLEMEQMYNKKYGIGPTDEAVKAFEKLQEESEDAEPLELSQIGMGEVS